MTTTTRLNEQQFNALVEALTQGPATTTEGWTLGEWAARRGLSTLAARSEIEAWLAAGAMVVANKTKKRIDGQKTTVRVFAPVAEVREAVVKRSGA